jgi:hypothetical protein
VDTFGESGSAQALNTIPFSGKRRTADGMLVKKAELPGRARRAEDGEIEKAGHRK